MHLLLLFPPVSATPGHCALFRSIFRMSTVSGSNENPFTSQLNVFIRNDVTDEVRKSTTTSITNFNTNDTDTVSITNLYVYEVQL